MPKNPHADFAPALEGYSGQGKFRFWCQMALPLTYDDSLSYYELLCKVVNYLNNTIEDVADVETNVSRLSDAYTQLQNYVNDYFDDLDVEAELRNVLDAMAEDGTLDDLLDPLVQDHLPSVVDEQIDDVVADQIDDAVAGQIGEVVAEQLPPLVEEGIPGEVSDWLTENVDPVGSAVLVDSSLTISGAAADAKVTGDELANLKTQLFEPYDAEQEITINTDGYYGINGTFHEAAGRQYAIIDSVDINATYKIDTSTGSTLIAGVLYLNSNNTVISYELLGTGTQTRYEGYELTIPNNCAKMIIQNTTTSTTLALYKEETRPITDTVFFRSDITIPVGSDLAENATVTLSGFTGDLTNGFTHQETESGRIQLYNANITQGIYILTFDTNYTSGEFVKCGFANDYKNLAYNGGTHIVMPLLNSDGNKYLYIDSIYNGIYTISNLMLMKIDKNGSESITLTTNSTLNINNENNLGFWNVILGKNTAERAVGSTRTIAIGNNALAALKGGHRNIGIGTFAMSQMNGGEGNVSIGADSMLEVATGNHNVAIGRESAYKGANLSDNVAIGHSAMFGSSSSSAYYNVVIGANAGNKLKSHRSTFVGYQAGYDIGGDANANYGNTMIGFNTKGKSDGYDNTCVGKQADFTSGKHNSIAIGANAVATKSNQAVIGNANVTEFVLGSKKIIFNEDGTVSWETVS